jgi:hypothetical protein
VAKPRRHTSARRLVDWADQHLGRKRLAQRGDAAHVHRLPGRVALSSSVVMKMMGNGEPDSDRPRRRSIPPPRRNPGRTRARRGQINTSSAPPKWARSRAIITKPLPPRARKSRRMAPFASLPHVFPPHLQARLCDLRPRGPAAHSLALFGTTRSSTYCSLNRHSPRSAAWPACNVPIHSSEHSAGSGQAENNQSVAEFLTGLPRSLLN